ncbi:hypothetical protein Dsin_000663 [Dipteronia sinensis]|uniref:Sulfotransferase n=1 Tax=Dipteronia sinensis TaxID=43782 RepID=A0AAE0B2T4_9ROSI|nr:hypothetical protein Dsin_000663 [Dipteronia sinensis]
MEADFDLHGGRFRPPVEFIEYEIYANNQVPDLSNFAQPRIFATHIPYHALEESMKKSDTTKIVYLCRNPFDTFISSWLFLKKLRPESLPQFSFEEAFKMYCDGFIGCGPFWEHMLGYYNESLKRPQHVLFLKYEDMKEDIVSNLRVLWLKELEVNKSGKAAMAFLNNNFENNYLFRKGQVGDWVNHFNPSMVNKLSQLMEDKFQGSVVADQCSLVVVTTDDGGQRTDLFRQWIAVEADLLHLYHRFAIEASISGISVLRLKPPSPAPPPFRD